MGRYSSRQKEEVFPAKKYGKPIYARNWVFVYCARPRVFLCCR